MNTIKVTKREATGSKLAALRGEGMMPAVVYGPKQDNVMITVDSKVFTKIYRDVGESAIISLEGLDDEIEVLVKAIDVDPISGNILHVDFYAIERGKKLEVTVPLTFINGESAPVVKVLTGTIFEVLHEITMNVLPKNIPQEIVVDLGGISEFSDQIQVGDLELPESAELITDPATAVITVSAPREDEPEEEAPVASIEDIASETGNEEDSAE